MIFSEAITINANCMKNVFEIMILLNNLFLCKKKNSQQLLFTNVRQKIISIVSIIIN